VRILQEARRRSSLLMILLLLLTNPLQTVSTMRILKMLLPRRRIQVQQSCLAAPPLLMHTLRALLALEKGVRPALQAWPLQGARLPACAHAMMVRERVSGDCTGC
jgi:hypothetical protein